MGKKRPILALRNYAMAPYVYNTIAPVLRTRPAGVQRQMPVLAEFLPVRNYGLPVQKTGGRVAG